MSDHQERTVDESTLRDLLQQMMRGWNQGSGQAFAAPFTEDDDYIVVNGRHLKGRAEIASAHQHIFDTFFRGSHLEGQVASIRFLSPDIALLQARCTLELPGPAEQVLPPEQTIPTMVAIRQAGGWAVTSFHNTTIQAESGQ